MAPQSKEFLLHPHVSKYLVVRKMKKLFKGDLTEHPEQKGKSIEELVLWKYHRVMNG